MNRVFVDVTHQLIESDQYEHEIELSLWGQFFVAGTRKQQQPHRGGVKQIFPYRTLYVANRGGS